VHLCAEGDNGFIVSSRDANIQMSAELWRGLLERNRGNRVYWRVLVRDEHRQWREFQTIENRIAREDADAYVSYRRLTPVHTLFANMGTFQRELSSFAESPILVSAVGLSRRCVNCHTFSANNPDCTLLHMRGTDGVAMLVARNGQVAKVDTRSATNPFPASYSTWHPNGRVIAFSLNDMDQFFHSAGTTRGVFDFHSDLALFLTESGQMVTTPAISDPDWLETFPSWSPDGKNLYFCRARRTWPALRKKERIVPADYRQVRYDIVRIAYDEKTGAWGKLETVLAARDTGWSVTEPRVSPDGRFLLVTMAEYGSFPVFLDSSDLYLMDLRTGKYWPLPINSPLSDSWHSWSSNSRWIVFASKRDNGLFGRLYLAHVDEAGQVAKPVLLPQHDPRYYDACLDNFNAPEFMVKPVSVSQREFLQAIYSTEAQSVVMDKQSCSVDSSGKAEQ
jgi:hypothetical protein